MISLFVVRVLEHRVVTPAISSMVVIWVTRAWMAAKQPEQIQNELDSPRGVCPLTARCIQRGHEMVSRKTPVVRGEDRVLMVPQSKG